MSTADDKPREGDTADEEAFTVTKIDDGIYLVRERYYTSLNVANIWIVQGSQLDLIIDTGIGLWDLSGFLTKHKLMGGDNGKKAYLAIKGRP